jgi:hypothetical protein
VTTPDSSHDFTPRPPLLWAGLIFFAVALSLCWPMLSGQYLAGDDQVIAGYAFREFGASYFKEHGSIPQWNPYLFGGMPFIAAMHGDIFYPTAWLRWVIPTDIGMTLGFFVHLILAGVAMYCLLRALKLSWTAAVVGGVSYELSGILVSMMRNGHDGKLFVSALAPFAFLALLRAIRHGKLSAFGIYALIIGLCMLSPHYQMTYYLLVASGLFTLWLTFWDKERERPKAAVADMGLAALSVGLGVGIGMIQGLPFLKYIPFSPRVEGGMSSGWEYATSYAMPVEELMTTVLPQFNGVMENYWGGNFFKSHTEYVGVLVIMLAILGLGAAKRRGLLLGFGMIAGLFLLVAFGGHTPFYRLWYEVMPMMQKVRAAGMAFFLVALPICVWAGLGAEQLLKGQVTSKRLWIVAGSFGVLALLGLAGALQGVAEGVASSISSGLDPQRSGRIMSQVVANAGELRAGALRLLLVVLIGGGVLVAVQKRLLSGAMAALAMFLAVWGDNWSLLRRFPEWLPPAAETYADDAIISAMRQGTMPFRSYDPSGSAGGAATLYQGSWLMADRIPTLFGYHGNESRFFDELFGGKNDWPNQFSPTLLDLYAVRYIVANQDVAPAFPGYRQTLGPVSFTSTTGRQALAGFLFERDSMPEWVRVVPGAVKAPADQIIPTVIDARFPADRVVLFADTATLDVPAMGAVPEPTAVSASLTRWEPGAMTVALSGSDPKTTFLVVAENWYPGWTATVDGSPAATHRANHAMLSVAIPSGAKEIVLRYETPGYGTGKLITLGSLAGALLLLAAGRFRPRTVNA